MANRAGERTNKEDYESMHLFNLFSMSPPQFGEGIVLSSSIDRQVWKYIIR